MTVYDFVMGASDGGWRSQDDANAAGESDMISVGAVMKKIRQVPVT